MAERRPDGLPRPLRLPAAQRRRRPRPPRRNAAFTGVGDGQRQPAPRRPGHGVRRRRGFRDEAAPSRARRRSPVAAPARRPADDPGAGRDGRLLPAVVLVFVLLGAVARDYFAPAGPGRAAAPGRPGAARRDPLPRRQARRRAGQGVADRPGADDALRAGHALQGPAGRRRRRGQPADLRPLGPNQQRMLALQRQGRAPLRQRPRPLGSERDDHTARCGSATTWTSRSRRPSNWCAASPAGSSTLPGAYRVENRDKAAHTVGLRFLLDTYIGANDGVPFTIPGDSELCDTVKDLRETKDKPIPDFLQALEKPDLAHPGTVAHLRLRPDDLKEAAAARTLGAWPSERAGRAGPQRQRPADAVGRAGPVDEVARPQRLGHRDVLEGGESRRGRKAEMGFEYGVGSLAGQGGRLAVTVDGASARRPVDGRGLRQGGGDEKVTLSLPEGFELVEGAATQPVPRPRARGATAPSPGGSRRG